MLGGSVFLGALAFFVALAANAPQGTYVPLELQLMRDMRHGGHPVGPTWLAGAVRDLTALGSAIDIFLMIVLIFAYLCLTRRYGFALWLVAATSGGEVLNTALKGLFDRPRPEAELHLVAVTSTSFPSGHAMAAAIFYLTVGLILVRLATRRREKVFFMATAVLLTGLAGFSRVYLGVHYPTDVLAGWAAGAAWALSCCFVADWLARRAGT